MIKWKVDEDTIEITANDKLTDEDFEKILPVIDNVMEIHGKPKFLIILDEFKGWEASAFWTDLKYDLKHRSDFGPMAVIGENIAEKILTQFSNVFFPSKLRYFKKSEEQEARRWLEAQKEIESIERSRE